MKNLSFFLLFIILANLGFGQSFRETLSHIPEDDKKAICSLFHTLFKDQFAYTLFTDKPVSLSGDFIITPMNNIQCGFGCATCFWNKWKIWEKYEKFFPLRNYILLTEHGETQSNRIFIILINKKSFIEIFNKHSKLFHKILGKDVQAENLLREIELKRISFQSAIKNNEILWGVLLGYGEHNAKIYAKRDKLLELKKWNQKNFLPFKLSEMDKIEEKINLCNQHLQPFGEENYFPLILDSVYFVADPEHPETKALRIKYRESQGKISAIYAKGNFLEITLSKLTSKD